MGFFFVGALLAAGAAGFPRCPVATPSDSYPAFPFKAFSAAYVEESLARPVDWRARGAVTPCKSQGAQGDCGAIAAPVSRVGGSPPRRPQALSARHKSASARSRARRHAGPS